MTTPRFNLPDITFADKSAKQTEADAVARFKALTSTTLGDADPRRMILRTVALLLVQQRALIDYSAKQNLLGYAGGDNLRHIGALLDVEVLPATAAKTSIRFSFSTATTRTIPAGARVTAGDGIYFAAVQDVTVRAGQSSVDVEAQCTQAGTVGNGYLPGEINILADPLQWVRAVANVTESEGGADLETDDAYAERIHQAPESFSTAGPDGAYHYWARTASQSIIDVCVYSPSPGVVELRPLLAGGIIPGQEVLDKVLNACNDRTIRPLTDYVQVLAPERVLYDINISYWISAADASLTASIRAKVDRAVEEYKLWQKSKLGRSIDPSELIAKVKNAGAKRVSIALPAHQQILPYQVAGDNLVTVTYGGLEND